MTLSIREQIEKVLEKDVRPSLAEHQGDVVIVDYADHVELTAVFTYIEHTFIRVHDHLQIRILVDHVHERLVLVVVFVKRNCFFLGEVAIKINRCQDSSCEVSSDRNEVQLALVTWSESVEGLPYLAKMLMGKRLIDREVIGPPTEMRGLGRSLACAGGAGDSRHVNLWQFVSLRHRQKRQLDRGREAARVGDMLSLHDLVSECLWKSIDKILRIGGQTEIVAEIYDSTLITLWQRMDKAF